jgi:hypothetical protein
MEELKNVSESNEKDEPAGVPKTRTAGTPRWRTALDVGNLAIVSMYKFWRKTRRSALEPGRGTFIDDCKV